MSSPQVTPITGLPQVNGWAQVITHPSRLLTCVLSVSGKNANSVGKTLAEHVAHFQAQTSAELHNALLDLLQSARQENCSLQLACILFTEERNILATHSGSVFLRRNHRVGEIITSQDELKIIEGPRVKDDLFVLSTHQATNTFPELKNILHRDSEDIVPELVADLHGKENSSLSAMAWIESSSEIIEPVGDTDEQFNNPAKKFIGMVGFGKAVNAVKRFPVSRLRKNPGLLLKKANQKLRAAARSLRKPSINAFGEDNAPKYRRFLLIGAGVIILLGALIGWKQYQINQEVQALQPRFGELQQQLSDAQAKADEDPLSARAEVREVMRGLEDLIAANQDKPAAVKRLKEEYQTAQNLADSISGSETQGPLDPFFDLRLAEAGFVASDLDSSGSLLLALDASGQKAVSLDTENKQTSPITLEDIGSGRALALEEDQLYILADGLHSYDLGDNNQHTQLKEQGDSDREGTMLGTFGSYLYVFNPAERNIYRYLNSDDGLSDPIGWLVDKQGFDFETIEAMTIDGDIWFTTQSGEILRYTQGSPSAFDIQELETPFDSPLKIATHPDSDYLYVLENSRQRLVILQKDGAFVREIISESLSAADTITASRTEDAAFIVSGSLVYKISL